MALFGAPAHFYQATCPRPIAPHSTVPLANYSPLHNSRLPPLAALFSHIRPLPYSHQSHSSISYDVTAPTPRTRQSLHPSVSIKMAACTQVNAAHCYQHCATLYTKRHGGNNISYPFFQKSDFQKKILGPFPGSRGLLPLIFEFPYSPSISPNFFPIFDLNSHFFLHCTAKRLNCTLIRPSCTTPRGAQSVGPRHTWPAFTPCCGGA